MLTGIIKKKTPTKYNANIHSDKYTYIQKHKHLSYDTGTLMTAIYIPINTLLVAICTNKQTPISLNTKNWVCVQHLPYCTNVMKI